MKPSDCLEGCRRLAPKNRLAGTSNACVVELEVLPSSRCIPWQHLRNGGISRLLHSCRIFDSAKNETHRPCRNTRRCCRKVSTMARRQKSDRSGWRARPRCCDLLIGFAHEIPLEKSNRLEVIAPENSMSKGLRPPLRLARMTYTGEWRL
jgi:hypothetical protein